jgi:hypothetical protein
MLGRARGISANSSGASGETRLRSPVRIDAVLGTVCRGRARAPWVRAAATLIRLCGKDQTLNRGDETNCTRREMPILSLRAGLFGPPEGRSLFSALRSRRQFQLCKPSAAMLALDCLAIEPPQWAQPMVPGVKVSNDHRRFLLQSASKARLSTRALLCLRIGRRCGVAAPQSYGLAAH